MPIYKTRWFDRWARKQGLATSSICKAVAEMGHGLFDADLGGGLFKKLAMHLLGLTSHAISQAQQAGELIEVNCHDEENQVPHPRSRS